MYNKPPEYYYYCTNAGFFNAKNKTECALSWDSVYKISSKEEPWFGLANIYNAIHFIDAMILPD